MKLPFFIARRLSVSGIDKKRSPTITVAICAVAISLIVMIISIAIVLGFKKEITSKIVGFNGHLTVYCIPDSEEDENIITLTPSLRNHLNNFPFIKDYSVQISIPAVLKTDTDFKGVYLKGLNGKNTKDFIEKNLVEGKIEDYSDSRNNDKIVISNIAARQLGLKVGDVINTYFFSDDIRVRKLTVSGIYNTHFDQYDDVMIYGSMKLIQNLASLSKDQGTFLQITTDNLNNTDQYAYELQNSLNEATANGDLYKLYKIDTVTRQAGGYFSWLSLLDTNVVVILTLMIIIGCVTLISGMLIIILERKKFIGLFKALGAKNNQIRNIFILVSLKIAISGLLIGNVVSLIFIYIQHYTHFIPLDADSYYIDFVPIDLNWLSFIYLNVGVIFIIYLTLILPSRFVAGITPSETLRCE